MDPDPILVARTLVVVAFALGLLIGGGAASAYARRRAVRMEIRLRAYARHEALCIERRAREVGSRVEQAERRLSGGG